MGTGGALLNLKKTKINDFVLINGDTIFDIDLKDFITSYKKNKIGCMAVASNRKNTNSYKLNNLTLKKSIKAVRTSVYTILFSALPSIDLGQDQ